MEVIEALAILPRRRRRPVRWSCREVRQDDSTGSRRESACGRLGGRDSTRFGPGPRDSSPSSSSSSVLVVSGSRRSIRLWDPGTGRMVRTFEEGQHAIWSRPALFPRRRSSSGSLVVSGHYDGTIRLGIPRRDGACGRSRRDSTRNVEPSRFFPRRRRRRPVHSSCREVDKTIDCGIRRDGAYGV